MSQATPQSNKQETENLNISGNNGVCQICDKHGHIALNCFNRFNHPFQANDITQALTTLTISDNYTSEWFPDIAATTYMIGNEGKLHNIKPYIGNGSFIVKNDNSLATRHIGNANIDETSKLFI